MGGVGGGGGGGGEENKVPGSLGSVALGIACFLCEALFVVMHGDNLRNEEHNGKMPVLID